MDLASNLALGLSTGLEPANLAVCVAGVTLGMLVGVLPGLGSLVTALILLAGIFYGGQYGGSVASILVNLPGTAANAVTCLDGYPMARDGRAGTALVVTALSSFVGASFAILAMMILAPSWRRWRWPSGRPSTSPS